jgi:hypothetical protein
MTKAFFVSKIPYSPTTSSAQYGTHHSYVLVVHTLRVAENEILKLDFPAKRH